MLRPSKKLLLALEAVVDVAFHGGAEPVQSQDIARRLGLPRRYLEQVLQQLVRAGILRGRARAARRLPPRPRAAAGQRGRGRADRAGDRGGRRGGEAPSVSPLGTRVVAPFWEQIERELLSTLEAVTIEDLCNRAERSASRARVGKATTS